MSKLQYIALDVDGTLTDGGLYIDSQGKETKRFCVQDGAGIFLAKQAGIQFIIITGRESGCVRQRAMELNIEYVFQNAANKQFLLREFMQTHNISRDEIGYIGDDLNDLDAMKLTGFIGCPVNAACEVKAVSDYIAKSQGGYGAVREILEYILRII